MMKIQDFRKLKIGFIKDDGSFLKEEDLEKQLNLVQDPKEKWFLRGLIHTLENHFSEAIKRFQLVDCKEAVILILACSYKTRDEFVFNEYKEKLSTDDCKLFSKYGIKPVFLYEGNVLDLNEILKL
ncbi:MAG: hypothetical protein C0178_03155 [Sulfurihydrogenibium sp.]|nr:MAG: hypothetical protein C0178_03155 [Sulfurihydrogenibium sp.]